MEDVNIDWDTPEGKIEEMVGKTFKKVVCTDDKLIFVADDGRYVFYHDQECCESVTINDVCGDLEDLVGFPIIRAEERTLQDKNPEGMLTKDVPEYQQSWRWSWRWTFYEFSTNKGSVTVRWYGGSNGYYSESVQLAFLKNS